MIKIDEVVKKETIYITAFVGVLSVLMQAVFLILSKWDYTVLLGNLLSGAASVLNFLFLGISVQKAVLKSEEDAKKTMQASRAYRMLFMVVVVLIGVNAPCFSLWAVLIPLFFPRIAISFRPLFDKKNQ